MLCMATDLLDGITDECSPWSGRSLLVCSCKLVYTALLLYCLCISAWQIAGPGKVQAFHDALMSPTLYPSFNIHSQYTYWNEEMVVPVHTLVANKPNGSQPRLCCSFTWQAHVPHPQQEVGCSSPPVLGAAAAARAAPAGSPAHPVGPAAAAAVASDGPSLPPPGACSAAAAPPAPAAGGGACPAAAAAAEHACTAMKVNASQLKLQPTGSCLSCSSCLQQECNMLSQQAPAFA